MLVNSYNLLLVSVAQLWGLKRGYFECAFSLGKTANGGHMGKEKATKPNSHTCSSARSLKKKHHHGSWTHTQREKISREVQKFRRRCGSFLQCRGDRWNTGCHRWGSGSRVSGHDCCPRPGRQSWWIPCRWFRWRETQMNCRCKLVSLHPPATLSSSFSGSWQTTWKPA